jgi:hypothetical protein
MVHLVSCYRQEPISFAVMAEKVRRSSVPLQPPETALTLYWKNSKVSTNEWPLCGIKEQLGGIQILETRDLNHAVQLSNSNQALSLDLDRLKYGRLRI